MGLSQTHMASPSHSLVKNNKIKTIMVGEVILMSQCIPVVTKTHTTKLVIFIKKLTSN